MADVSGNGGEPIARLGPLGWTCVEATARNVTNGKISYIVHSFLTLNQAKWNCIDEQYDVNNVLRKFWEVDSYGTQVDRSTVLTKDEKEALSFYSLHYSTQEVGIESQYVPWKENSAQLSNNYFM